MGDDTAEGDDRLRLIFTCCHPALSREAQVALTLRAVAGLTTIEIARAFITSEATIAQRIVRAKRKIVEARIPYRVPAERDMGERVEEVLAVLYLMFNEGYLATAGGRASRRDLAEDAIWLAGLMVRLMPEAQRQAAYAPINQWFEKYGSKITGGHELQPERTATTVKFNNGKPVVTDGPFIEGKESIGGYAEVTVADLDEAIEMAKGWPTGGLVEVRPVVDRGEPQR